MKPSPRRPLRLKLRHLLFLALVLSGIIPLAVSSFLLVHQNREVLENQERQLLVTEANTLSQEVSGYLASLRKQLAQVGYGILTGSGEGDVEERLGQPWVRDYLSSVNLENPGDFVALRVLDASGQGVASERPLPEPAQAALRRAFDRARGSGRPAYELAVTSEEDPLAAVAVPVARGFGAVPREPAQPEVVVEAVVPLHVLGSVFQRDDDGREVGAALIDAKGRILWSAGIALEQRANLSNSYPVRLFVTRPLSALGQYEFPVAGTTREMIVQISPISETGWGLVAQKPLSTAFRVVDQVVRNTLWSTVLLVLLALFFAVFTARRVSEPVQRLAESTHQIAAGNFGERIEVAALTAEFVDLAADFNRMGGHVERYVDELKRAAAANRELFIGSLRSFAAAIDAKDPYTRGHSERVAALARTIGRHLNLGEEVQHRVWIAALLHDVGKIGVEDRILQKGGELATEEFEQMKAHTVIGAEILAPIEQLREMIPAVRWHHENWNGRGYPDGLQGERIPLLARIVAVADTVDAVTTDRPYQRAYSLEEAVATVRRLAGTRFDAKVVTAFLRAYERGEVKVAPLRPRPVRRAGGEAAPSARAETGT